MAKTVRLFQCMIQGYSNDVEAEIPDEFYKWIKNTDFKERWEPQAKNGKLKEGIELLNIKNFKPEIIIHGKKNTKRTNIYTGIMIDATNDNRNMIDINGNVQLEETQEAFMFPIAIIPKAKIAIVSGKDNVTQKLCRYLESKIIEFGQSNNINNIDEIKVKAVPLEDKPSMVLRRNKNLGSFQAKLNVAAFKERFGMENYLKETVFEALTPNEDQEIIVTVDFSAGRGQSLPEVMIDNIIEMVEQAENNNQFQGGNYRSMHHNGTSKTPHLPLRNMLKFKLVTINVNKDNSDVFLNGLFAEIREYSKELLNHIK